MMSDQDMHYSLKIKWKMSIFPLSHIEIDLDKESGSLFLFSSCLTSFLSIKVNLCDRFLRNYASKNLQTYVKWVMVSLE